MTVAGPLLELTTVDPTTRPFVEIDGERYDLAVSADFGILDYARLDALVDRLNALRDSATADTLTPDQVDALAGVLRDGAAMVLRAPADVLDRLNDTQRFAVVQAFTSPAQGTER
jgi:hypothetical protein